METILYTTVASFKKALKSNGRLVKSIQVISTDDLNTANFVFTTNIGETWITHKLDISINITTAKFDTSFKKPNFMKWIDIIIMTNNLRESNYISLLSLINDKNVNDIRFILHICNNWDNLKLIDWNQHELFIDINNKRFLMDRFIGKEDVNSPFYKH